MKTIFTFNTPHVFSGSSFVFKEGKSRFYNGRQNNLEEKSSDLWVELKDHKQNDSSSSPLKATEDFKLNLVVEGRYGQSSVDEICNRENVSKETFLEWCSEFNRNLNGNSLVQLRDKPEVEEFRQFVIKHSDSETLRYIESFLDVPNIGPQFTYNGKEVLISSDLEPSFSSFICLSKINDFRRINKRFEAINSKLPVGGIFVGCMETFQARKRRLRISNIPVVNSVYFLGEFVFKRIIPKLSLTKKFYFDITKGNDRLLSKAEGLGRLVSCGFKIVDFKVINGLIYFIVRKEKAPDYNLNPSYGPVYCMPRVGKNGKEVNVYKFRTMHPYSEYLQDYVIKVNGYGEKGKPANDFRIPSWGKVMRKYWLDEIPQLLNVLKGEMKLVGIRPVSKRYLEDIPKEMQKLRLTQKPGCIPPYVSLNRSSNVTSVLRAEKDYLLDKIKNPYTTDLRYFIKALFNIVFRHKRSA